MEGALMVWLFYLSLVAVAVLAYRILYRADLRRFQKLDFKRSRERYAALRSSMPPDPPDDGKGG